MPVEEKKNLHRVDDYPYEEITSPLLAWYRENKRDLPWRKDGDPYRVWVSEIMLQQTRVEGAKEYYKRFLEKFPTVYDLAAADEESLLKVWEGLGYYSRVRNMQKAARQVRDEHAGVFPDAPEKLRALAGIGDYTAGAIASIAYGRRAPAVDGNVFRVLSRLTENPTDISLPAYKKYLEEKLRAVYPEEGKACSDFTQALMELGALVCKPTSPDCETCPLRALCRAKERGRQEDYPVLPKKKDKREEKLFVFVLVTKDGVALRRREKGVLKGMYEFPTAPQDRPKEEILRGWGVDDYRIVKVEKAVHIFTHIRWEMDCVLVRAESTPFEQFTIPQIREKISLPTAFVKAKEMLEKEYGV
ncbi:MAG: A/G-specific adenine glycosylase [Clostridia bacterium]|nr:A/G-specific adenine glycosylase [Clostridia bacterium]